MLAEIRGSYEELNIFWKEEAFRAAKVLKERRTDLRDFECWNSFYSSLKLAIELWKVCYLPLQCISRLIKITRLESATEW